MDGLKKKSYLFYVYYFAVFCGVSLVNSFMSMYMANHGVSEATVGFLNGIVQMLGLLLYPIIGRLADKTPTKNTVLYAELMLCLLFVIVFYRSSGLLMMEIMMVVFMTIFYGLTVIYETITVDYTSKTKIPYAPIRMCGTIGFSIMAGVSGFFLASKEDLLFPLLIAVLVTVTFLAFLLPKSFNKGKDRTADDKAKHHKDHSVLLMLKDREV
ncbi:MAG: MFS transporter, partial [Erysipelotrichaceae bacterium]|nr:MFS transporter [Erysipelotrichaceae bacterium]